jgi:hypothetical protein
MQSMRRHVRGFMAVAAGHARTQVVGAPPPGVSMPESQHGDFHRTLTRVVDANLEAQRRFTPRVYDGDIALFRAGSPFVEPYQDPYLGWGPVVRGRIDTFVVPGDHSEITVNPFVHVLARQLDGLLQDAQSNARRT